MAKVRVPPLVVLSLPATEPLTGVSSLVVLVSSCAVRSLSAPTVIVTVRVRLSPVSSSVTV